MLSVQPLQHLFRATVLKDNFSVGTVDVSLNAAYAMVDRTVLMDLMNLLIAVS